MWVAVFCLACPLLSFMVVSFHLFLICMKALLQFYCTLEWPSLIPASLHALFISPSPTMPLFQQQALWPVLKGCSEGSFNQCRWAGVEVGSSWTPKEEGWPTHLLLLTAVSWPAFSTPFHPSATCPAHLHCLLPFVFVSEKHKTFNFAESM